MRKSAMVPMKMTVAVEKWPLVVPFRITGHTWETLDVLHVTLEHDGQVGRGEAAGVYYRGDQPDSMLKQLESVRRAIESGVTRDSARSLLPPGGARNGLDCALWELEAARTGQTVWQLAGLEEPRPLLTTFTCGADSPERMAATAINYKGARAIKLKLTGEAIDADRVRAVRDVLPKVWIGVDANQGFTRASLERLMPVLVDAKIKMVEQPFPIGQEWLLDGFRSPIPIAADESAQTLNDISSLVGRFNVVNIKLDKCGGLTEGLAIVRAARTAGLDTMVGNMIGTSLAMAPAFLVGQLCKVVDLDGPVFLKGDRAERIHYCDGLVSVPATVWG